MGITTEQIKELRDKTGVSVMQCKKALEEAGGDMEKALAILKQKSKDIAAKKGDRALAAGVVQAYIHTSSTIGAMVELVCETDFVSNNEEFKTLARDIAMHITATSPEFIKLDTISDEAKHLATAAFEEEVKSHPENLRAKILEGKLKAFFEDKTLYQQEFIKNPDITVGGLIESAIQKFGEKIEVAKFSRFSVLEK
jgi:elongation factor Ts